MANEFKVKNGLIVQGALTASFAYTTASWAISSIISNTSNYASQSQWTVSSSFASSSLSSSYLLAGNYSVTSSWAGNAIVSNTSLYASQSQWAVSSSFASSSVSASYVDAGGITTGTLNNSRLPSQINVTGVTASLFGTASYSINADTLDGLHSSSFQATLVTGGTYFITSSWAGNSIVSNTSLYASQSQWAVSASFASSSLTASSANDFLVRNNLTVNGILYASQLSSSQIYITSSQLTVTDNIITINALSPHVRYAGLEMHDSGSTEQMASFLWDSQNNYFFLSSSDAGYSRRIVTGPDNEGALSIGYVPIATGSNGLVDSIAYQNGNTFIVNGTISASNIIATINGTASWANNAVYALTSNTSYTSTSSLFATSALSTSFASSSVSSSFAITSSNLIGWYFNNTGSILLSTNTQTAVISIITGSYLAAFFDYAAKSGSNIRTGTIFGSWVNNSITYAEVCNVDVGDTSQVSMSLGLVGNAAVLSASVSSTTPWTIKALGRYI